MPLNLSLFDDKIFLTQMILDCILLNKKIDRICTLTAPKMLDGVQKTLLVHRKGSTRAFPPHHPLIPVDYQVSIN